jgi:energy-coupling factor transport system permease protein
MFSIRTAALGQYIDTQSVIHQLDPRTKCLAVLLLMMEVFLINKLYFLVLTVLGCVGITLLAKLPMALIMRNVRPFVWLFGITFGIHLLFTPGQPLPYFPRYGLLLTYEGVTRGLFFSLRLLTFIFAAAVFTLTTSPTELTDGLEKMLKPLRRLRVPVHELAMIMTISLRFIPTLLEEAERLRKAQLTRAVRFSGNLMKRIKTFTPFLVPLFLSSFRRADELAFAMDARCYRGSEGRTHYHELQLTIKDGIALAVTGIFCLGAFLIT